MDFQVKWKLRHNWRHNSKDRRKYQSFSPVTIDETISKEYFYLFSLSIRSSFFLHWFEGVILRNYRLRLRDHSCSQCFKSLSDDLGFGCHCLIFHKKVYPEMGVSVIETPLSSSSIWSSTSAIRTTSPMIRFTKGDSPCFAALRISIQGSREILQS